MPAKINIFDFSFAALTSAGEEAGKRLKYFFSSCDLLRLYLLN